MSIYDELPVFKASYDLLLDIFQFIANFKRVQIFGWREIDFDRTTAFEY